VIAYKFLLPERVGPFSGFAWPVETWVAAGDERACATGVHACEPADLPFWLHDELWEIELRGPVVRGRHKVVAEAGRLLRRHEGWNEQAAVHFSASCVERVRELAERRPEAAGHLDDLAGWAPHVRPAAVASLAARAAEAVGGRAGYDAERAAQSAWLAGRLGLEPGPGIAA
jgi:hypothetical protein